MLVKLSIITVTLNSAKSLRKTIDSVLGQSYESFEHIIIDGKSTDNTEQVVRSYNDPRIIFRSELDSGLYHAMNKGLSIAQGDLICFLNSDDWLFDNTVLSDIAKIYKTRCPDIILNGIVFVSGENKIVKRRWVPKHFNNRLLKLGWSAPHPGFFFTKKIYDLIGPIDVRYRISADYDFILRGLNKADLVVCSNKIAVSMSLGGISSNSNLKGVYRKVIEDAIIANRNGLYGLFTAIMKRIIKVNQFINV